MARAETALRPDSLSQPELTRFPASETHLREEGIQSRTIAATPEELFEAVSDFRSYPIWTGNVREVEVLESRPDGQPTCVRYTSGALGFTAEYTLKYEFDPPREMRWVLREGRISGPLVKAEIRHLDGFYRFDSVDSRSTKVTYKVSAELSIPLGPLRKKAENVIVSSALKELQGYVEP